MIRRVRGVLESVDGLNALVTPEGSGISYEVLIPSYLFDRLAGEVGQSVELHTMEVYEAQAQGSSFIPRLIGFGSLFERRFFELFVSVKGLGVRRGLRAMAHEPRQIAKAIAERDAKQLQQLPEIGKKLSETIVLELREKVDSYVEGVSKPGGSVEGKPATGVNGEAVAALIALGESPADAERRVGIIMERHPELSSTDAIVSAAFAASG